MFEAETRFAHQTALSAAETLVNQALRLDPATLRCLGEIEGRSMRVVCVSPAFSVCMVAAGDGFRFLHDPEGEAEVTLTGSSTALIRLAGNPAARSELFSRDIEVEGDTELAEHIAGIMEDLELDMEGLLARMTGDVAAHEIHRGATGLLGWLHNAMLTLQMDLGEFIQEEARVVPGQSEQQQFFEDVDSLRMATDRLEARVARLQSTLRPESDVVDVGGDP